MHEKTNRSRILKLKIFQFQLVEHQSSIDQVRQRVSNTKVQSFDQRGDLQSVEAMKNFKT